MRLFKGKSGEKKAAEFLKKNGYSILQMNYRSKTGEIDIIAEKDNVVVFVEVKTRTTDKYGSGFEAVGHTKQGKIARTAEAYIIENKIEKLCRFDVISIDKEEITHIISAFGV